jgi:hypothetical protein
MLKVIKAKCLKFILLLMCVLFLIRLKNGLLDLSEVMRRYSRAVTDMSFAPNVSLGLPLNLNYSTDPSHYRNFHPLPSHVYPNASDVILVLSPTLGQHRPHQDAVMTIAYGYNLPQLIYFLTSLWETGYDGDLVLGLNPNNLTMETRRFIEYASIHHHLVVYELDLQCSGGSWACQTRDMFASAATGERIKDVRRERHVAELRFEYYWAFSIRYAPNARILITDSRDVYFQQNPFASLASMETTLFVHEEIYKIRLSTPNRHWVTFIYGKKLARTIYNRPIICSATTLGGQPAMEMYNRAMVHEWDQTISMNWTSPDQGRHNGLVHFKKLEGSPNITKVYIVPVGEGQVNTIGIQLEKLELGRTPLEQWNGYNATTQQVLNNDGTPSPVVHMFDRHTTLKEIIGNRTFDALQAWKMNKRKK